MADGPGGQSAISVRFWNRMTVSFRPCRRSDELFLRDLTIGIVSAELGADAWPEELRAPLLEMQYRSRVGGLESRYSDGAGYVILADGTDAGFVFYRDLPEALHVVDIMVDLSRQGQGIGSGALRRICEYAGQQRKPVRLAVSKSNARAFALYERVGFRVVGEGDLNFTMESTGL